MKDQELFHLLSNHPMFHGKVTLLEQGNRDNHFSCDCVCVRIRNCLVFYVASNPPPLRLECTVDINHLTHFHVYDNEVIKSIEEIVADTVFVERPDCIQMLRMSDYEKQKKKLLRKKNIKVYTAQGVILHEQ